MTLLVNRVGEHLGVRRAKGRTPAKLWPATSGISGSYPQGRRMIPPRATVVTESIRPHGGGRPCPSRKRRTGTHGATRRTRRVSGCLAAGRAAQELDLRRGEFDLAVHLGLSARGGAGGAGVARGGVRQEESTGGRAGRLPQSLRERVRTAGTAEGAALLGIRSVPLHRPGAGRVHLAGALLPQPLRAVVWLYWWTNFAGFGAREPQLLAGKSRVGMRTMLEAGVDWRAPQLAFAQDRPVAEPDGGSMGACRGAGVRSGRCPARGSGGRPVRTRLPCAYPAGTCLRTAGSSPGGRPWGS